MTSFNARTKSIVLACAMIVSAQSACIELSNPLTEIGSFFTAHQAALLPIGVGIGLALKVRLDTKPRGTYSYDNLQEDVMNLLNSYNIFDANSRATIFNFIDKYFVGAKLRLDDSTIRVKEDDGSVVTTKRKKLTQKPSGMMGLIDAYGFQQLEANNKLLVEIVGMYILLNTPDQIWNKLFEKVVGAPGKSGASSTSTESTTGAAVAKE
ncbi:MAG TPA: hypothetical protein VHX42_04225 [Candidatus Babeliales bacterium]|jgi:hypothetical protein|nr:hypothetical protein [Candidatus Babeliales bacterium]